jgi:hypothetical protein
VWRSGRITTTSAAPVGPPHLTKGGVMAERSEDKLGRLLRSAVPKLSNAEARDQLERFEREYQQRVAAGTVPEYQPPTTPNPVRRAVSTVRAWWRW